MSDSAREVLMDYAKTRGYLPEEAVNVESESEKVQLNDDIIQSEKFECLQARNEENINSGAAPDVVGLAHACLAPSASGEMFSNFVNWVRHLKEDSLEKVLFPLFLYLLEEILLVGQLIEAEQFFERFASHFTAEQQLLVKSILSSWSETKMSDFKKSDSLCVPVEVSVEAHTKLLNFCGENFTILGLIWKFSQRKLRVVPAFDNNSGGAEQIVEEDETEKTEDKSIETSKTVQDKDRMSSAIIEASLNDASHGKEQTSVVITDETSQIEKPVTCQTEPTKSLTGTAFKETVPLVRYFNLSRLAGEHLISCDLSHPDAGYAAAGLENSTILLCRLNKEYQMPEDSMKRVEKPPFVLTMPEPKSAKLKQQTSKPPAKKTRRIMAPPIESFYSKLKRNDFQMLKGHSAPVYDVKFVPGTEFGCSVSRYLLSASGDHTVRLFDLWQGGLNLFAYQGHTGPVWNLDISPEKPHQLFASASLDQTAKLFTFERIYPIRNLAAHSASVACVKFHPNGQYLATGSADSTVRLWSLTDAFPVRLFQGFQGEVDSLAFTADGQYLACASSDRKLHVWDIASGKPWNSTPSHWHNDQVHSMAFFEDWLVSASADSWLRLWDWKKEHKEEGWAFQAPNHPAVMSFRCVQGNDSIELVCAGTA